MRAGSVAAAINAWLRGNLWHEFSADPTTQVSSNTGYVPFRSNLKGSWYEVQLGVSAKLSRTTSLYADVGYDKAFNNGIQAVNGTVGLRVNW